MLLLLLLVTTDALEAARFRLTIEVRDNESGELVGSANVSLRYAANIQRFQIREDAYVLDMQIGDMPARTYELQIDTSEPYISRTVPIYLTPPSHDVARTWTFYVARQQPEYTYGYLRAGERYFDDMIDRAVAHYQAARLFGLAAGEFEIKARALYARALSEACRKLNYATCEETAEEYSALISDLPGRSEEFSAEGLTAAMLERDLRDVNDHMVVREYRSIRLLYEEGEYELAAEIAEAALDRYQLSEETFIAYGLTESRLHADAGASYMRAAELATGEARLVHLARARTHFMAINDENAVALTNASVLTID